MVHHPVDHLPDIPVPVGLGQRYPVRQMAQLDGRCGLEQSPGRHLFARVNRRKVNDFKSGSVFKIAEPVEDAVNEQKENSRNSGANSPRLPLTQK